MSLDHTYCELQTVALEPNLIRPPDFSLHRIGPWVWGIKARLDMGDIKQFVCSGRMN